MQTGLLPSLRAAVQFSRAWRTAPLHLDESEVPIPCQEGEGLIQGTVVEPEGSRLEGSPLRGWVVLHGMTRLGRSHPELRRFVRAIASTGARVLVPEIRRWTELEFATEQAQGIIKRSIEWLHASPLSTPGGVMVVGFSFGAAQALFSAAGPEMKGKIAGVVGWGGYADIERTFRFSFTGEHEWDGASYVQRPDPYSRWVIGHNCLSLSPRLHTHEDLVSALKFLAVEAGEKRIQSWDPASDSVKAAAREGLSSEGRRLFDLFAPPALSEPDRLGADALVDELVPLIRRGIPLIEPVDQIQHLGVPIRLLHGRSDHLIPFTETLRLASKLRAKAPDLSTQLTGLFSHSGDQESAGPAWGRLRENLRFLGGLRRVFAAAQGHD